MEANDVSVDAVPRLRVTQLRQWLKKAGASTAGKKAELVARMQALLKKRQRPAENEGDDTDGEAGGNDGGNENGEDDDDIRPPAAKRARVAPPSAPAAAAAAPASGRKEPEETGGGDDDDDSSSDDDFGPALPAPTKARKKKKALAHETDFLDKLPSAEMYEKSYMHRDRISFIVVTPKSDFIVTASVDGHLKFWKKMKRGVEFVKHYKAHLGKFTGVAASRDGLRLCTTAEDKTMKFYNVMTFDMTVMVQLEYDPGCCEWAYRPGKAVPLVAIADTGSPAIRVYNADSGTDAPIATIRQHFAPVTAMAFNPKFNVIISGDGGGGLEYWSCKTFKPPKKVVKFRFKSETDLFALNKAKTQVRSVACSPNGMLFVVTAADFQIRVFNYVTGKLKRVYDESVGVYQDAHDDGTLGIDDMDYGRRMAVERDLRSSASVPPSNALFDQTSNFIMYPTAVGIRVVNIKTNRTVRYVGKIENTERFVCLALFQGIAKSNTQMELLQKKNKPKVMSEDDGPQYDPTLFATAYKSHRFYLFTKREPDDSETAEARDVFNEAPRKEDRLVHAQTSGVMGDEAILHTSYGDIRIKLFVKECPRTVENFCTHATNGYYDKVIFHRVIKSFMIQTGDPLGDGTGGESIWGGEFEDEFHPSLRHDRAFTVSMANAGPNTNGSQFFITTKPTEWLDNKHTVFGRVVAGMEVVTRIENVKTNKNDKPYEDIRIENVSVK